MTYIHFEILHCFNLVQYILINLSIQNLVVIANLLLLSMNYRSFFCSRFLSVAKQPYLASSADEK